MCLRLGARVSNPLLSPLVGGWREMASSSSIPVGFSEEGWVVIGERDGAASPQQRFPSG